MKNGHNRDFRADIAQELYLALQKFGAKPDLLGIIGSYGDTLSDEAVLGRLKEWNAKNAIPPHR